MATNESKEGTIWPMPKFRFEVDFGPSLKNIAFQEVSGLDNESQVIEYRHGNAPTFSTVKMPGLKTVGNVTMKKGVFPDRELFLKWEAEIKMNTIQRRTVLIKLLDESGKPMMQWQLVNAWPTKIVRSALKPEGNENTIESIELACEQLITINK